MKNNLEKYDVFSDRMETKFPKMFGAPYGGFAIDEGWWPIVETLCENIQRYTDWANETRERLLKDNPHNQKIPEAVPQVTVEQIKEKFGDLRFYYSGGDERIYGMVRMAESWANKSCEVCGVPGVSRNDGWIKTLCDRHDAERKERNR